MQKTYILDTSVAIAWYLSESFSQSARTWQDKAILGEINLIAPSLHYWEFANVLRTHVRRDDLEKEIALELYKTHLLAPVRVVNPDMNDVLTTALHYESTSYDAVYISLSLELSIPLLTAERSTRAWVKKLGKNAKTIV